MVVADFELRYSRSFPFGGLNGSYALLYISGKASKVVQLGVISGFNNAAVFKSYRRLINNRSVDKVFNVIKDVNISADFAKKRGTRSA